MNFSNYIAVRYLLNRENRFLSFSNIISFLGMGLSVFSLLIVISVMNGFSDDLRNRVIGMKADIFIYANEHKPIKNYEKLIKKIKNKTEIDKVAPVYRNELLIQRKGLISATINYGVDFDRQKRISNALELLWLGKPDKEKLQNGIIIGSELAYEINSTVGDYVQVTSPIGNVVTPLGLLPKTKSLKVIGIFSSGMPEFDRSYTYSSLSTGTFFSNFEEGVNRIEIKHHNNLNKTAEALKRVLGKNYEVEKWTEMESNLFQSMKIEKIVMFSILSFMIILSSLNLIGNFIKLITEKKQDIGILKSFGTSVNLIKKVFLKIGILISGLGILTGTSFALVLLLIQDKYQLIKLPITGLPINYVPVNIHFYDIILTVIIAFVISIIAIYFPLRKLKQIQIIEIIRN